MENFYDRWLKFWDEEETERAKARKVIHEEELEWIQTRQDKRIALLASPDNGSLLAPKGRSATASHGLRPGQGAQTRLLLRCLQHAAVASTATRFSANTVAEPHS